MNRWPLIRDLILFFFGLGGAAWEVTTYANPNTTVMIFFGACMGLPAFLPDGLVIGRREKKDDE